MRRNDEWYAWGVKKLALNVLPDLTAMRRLVSKSNFLRRHFFAIFSFFVQFLFFFTRFSSRKVARARRGGSVLTDQQERGKNWKNGKQKVSLSACKSTKNGPVTKRIFSTIQGGREPEKTPKNGALSFEYHWSEKLDHLSNKNQFIISRQLSAVGISPALKAF